VVTAVVKMVRAGRAGETRDLILAAAERLYAEHGVLVVSNRQVGEAAGQGNNFAVGYHFGTRIELVRAIVRKHTEPIELIRQRMVTEIADSTDLRDWVACLVRPTTEHLATMGSPTWFARFTAQVMTEPPLREIVVDEALTSAAPHLIIDGVNKCLPHLPAQVRTERADMARHLIVHMCAERERALAESIPTPRSSWHEAASGLIDAIVGLWLAPVRSVRREED
jgi:AcrR family transcriptional regulator